MANPADGAVMVWVPGTAEACPGGKFRMGNAMEEFLPYTYGWDKEGQRFVTRELPAHEVELDGLWLYKCEVTVGQYAKFLVATRRPPPPAEVWDALRTHPDLPMVFVRWDEAAAYCEWAGGMLPTEAQWEYAARGPEGRVYPWGDQWDRTRCNSAEYHAGQALNSAAVWKDWWRPLPTGVATMVEHLRAPGSFPSDVAWCGAFDMAGNACEWCRDWYEEAFYGTAAATQRNPECRSDRWSARAVRGGSWIGQARNCRAAARGGVEVDATRLNLGLYGLRPARLC